MDAAKTPLPPLDQLTYEQRRGADCVVCGDPVRSDDAVDIGERLDEDGTRVFPRVHPRHLEGGTP